MVRTVIADRAVAQQPHRARGLLALSPPPAVGDVSTSALGIAAQNEGNPSASVPESLQAALKAREPLVVVIGSREAGTSRVLLDAIRADEQLSIRRLLVPADGAAFSELLATPANTARPGTRSVLWLDGLERFLAGLRLHVGRAPGNRHLRPSEACWPLGANASFTVALDQNPAAALQQAWQQALHDNAVACRPVNKRAGGATR